MRKILVPFALVIAVIALLAFILIGILQIRPKFSHDPASIEDSRQEAIEQFTLSNGMEVIIAPNHRVPAVSHTLWIRVGASDDPQGHSGIAHYLEHLMFKGTPTMPEGDYERRLTQMGGQFNAFTSSDFTGYYFTIAKEHLPKAMAMEADRFQALMPKPESFAKELQVVIEERRSRTENNPGSLLDEEMRASLFRQHPYHRPIIGWMHEIETLTPEDATAFYNRYYHPGNMLLVVSGDISRAELQPLAERLYGALPVQREKVIHDWTQEPPQRAPRQIVMTHPQVGQPRFSRYYAAPSYGGADKEYAMPLEVLSYWLGGGKSSILYKTLVKEKGLATSTSADYSGMVRGPGLFTITVTPAEGVTMDQIDTAVNECVEKARKGPIDEATLVRAKTLMKAEVVYARDGLEPVAQIVGYLRMLDLDLSYYTDWVAHVEAITSDQVQASAKIVLNPEQSVTGQLLPSPDAEGKPNLGALAPAQGGMDAPAIVH